MLNLKESISGVPEEAANTNEQVTNFNETRASDPIAIGVGDPSPDMLSEMQDKPAPVMVQVLERRV